MIEIMVQSIRNTFVVLVSMIISAVIAFFATKRKFEKEQLNNDTGAMGEGVFMIIAAIVLFLILVILITFIINLVILL